MTILSSIPPWAWRSAAVIGLLASFGCAHQSPRVTHLPGIRPNLRVIELPLRQVDRACRRPNTSTDRGEPYPVWYWPNAIPALHGEQPGPPPERVLIPECYERSTNTIYVDEMGGISLVIHGLCHASGRSRLDCAEVGD